MSAKHLAILLKLEKNVHCGFEKKVCMKTNYEKIYIDVIRVIILGICDYG